MNKTQCIVIGEESTPKSLTPIEFKYFLNFSSPQKTGEEILPASEMDETKPSDYKFIELICKDYIGFDLMFAHNGERCDGILYMGKWNDGIVS